MLVDGGWLRPQAVAFLAVGALVMLLPGATAAQTSGGAAGSGAERIELRWALRGIVIGNAERVAIVEDRPTGVQRLVRVGDALGDAVAVAEIAPRYLTLNADGGSVTLRIGHVAARPRAVRPPVPVQRQRLPRAWMRAGRR